MWVRSLVWEDLLEKEMQPTPAHDPSAVTETPPLTVGHGETMLDFCSFSLVGTDYRPRQEMTRATFFPILG